LANGEGCLLVFSRYTQSSAYAHDVQKLNPLHVIAVGILAAILFVLLIVALVQWVVHSGVAA